MSSTTMESYEVIELPYAFDALEPYISKEIMTLHYEKHYKTYLANFNKALESYKEAEAKKDVAGMIALGNTIKFNGGGFINHSIFWKNLAPKSQGGGEPPKGPLAEAIKRDFGSLEKLIEEMSAKSIAIQGSGWGWLGYNKAKGRLEIAVCENQDPLSTKGLIPLLGIDVWEHAYYLQYKNVRADYVKNIWNIVNWSDVSGRFQKAIA